MKKLEMNLSESFLEPFFKVLGKNGVAEAIVNLFNVKEKDDGIIGEKISHKKARVEFYCPDAAFERLKIDIVAFAKKTKDTFNLEILGLEEKISILKEKGILERIKERGISCL